MGNSFEEFNKVVDEASNEISKLDARRDELLNMVSQAALKVDITDDNEDDFYDAVYDLAYVSGTELDIDGNIISFWEPSTC